MSKNQRLASEIKQQILNRIRNEGVSVKQAAQEHGLSDRTIYGWLKHEATGGPSIGEVTKWHKERHELLTLIGELTVKLSETQKKR